MKDGRTFRMRITEHVEVYIEVHVPKGKTQQDAERAVEWNYAQLRRDGALMTEIAREQVGRPTIREVIEVVNRG